MAILPLQLARVSNTLRTSVATQTIAEHRMYLPLAAVVAALVLTIGRAVAEVRPLLAARGFAVPQRLRTLEDVFAYAEAEGVTLRIDGMETQVRRPNQISALPRRPKDLDDLPTLVAEFAASGGAAVWDFHVSDKVVSPTIRRAHPHTAGK